MAPGETLSPSAAVAADDLFLEHATDANALARALVNRFPEDAGLHIVAPRFCDHCAGLDALPWLHPTRDNEAVVAAAVRDEPLLRSWALPSVPRQEDDSVDHLRLNAALALWPHRRDLSDPVPVLHRWAWERAGDPEMGLFLPGHLAHQLSSDAVVAYSMLEPPRELPREGRSGHRAFGRGGRGSWRS